MNAKQTQRNHAKPTTPGPWHCEGGWISSAPEHGVGGEACVIAQVHSGPDCAPVEHADGNAALITAAPEMYAALRAIKTLWDKHGLGDDDNESEPVHAALIAALAKAERLPAGNDGDVAPGQACPRCGERRMDLLVWTDDRAVTCQSCGKVYDPAA